MVYSLVTNERTDRGFSRSEREPMGHQRIVNGVNYLIEAANFSALSGELTRIIETWDTHPMVYSGKLAPLNALIDVGLQSREAFEKLIDMAEDRRKSIPRARRVDYQRDLMRERRARIAKAVELNEKLHGPIRGVERNKYVTELQTRWRRARDKFIADKGDLDWKARNDAANEFWEMIDRQLDQNLADARRKTA